MRHMASDSERGFIEALTGALEPYLGAEARKAGRSLRAILDLFPAQSLPEIEKSIRSMQAVLALFPGRSPTDVEKSVRSLQAEAQKDVPALVARARAVVGGESAESASDLMKAVSKLKADELKHLGTSLELALTGTKTKQLADLRTWLESGGTERPLTAEERTQQKAKGYAAGFEGRMASLDAQAADEVIRRAESALADKEVGAKGFPAFAELLGISVSGTRAKMLQQFKDSVNRLAVSHGQTQF
jgi:hypothetical protein